VYKVSHKQVFHLNSKPQICYELTLQVISHQIKDNMHNHHGSIGLYKVGFLVGNFGFGRLTFSPFCFPFSFCFVWERGADIKIWFVTKANDRFTHSPGLTKLLSLFSFIIFFFPTILHIVQTLSGPKNRFFFSIFLCFSSIFD